MAKKTAERSYKILAQMIIKCPKHNKVLHRELEDAEKQAKGYRKRIGSKMDVYHCSMYEGWHIGHHRAHKGRKAGKLKGVFPRVK